MTQKEAIIKALEDLGGRGRLADIYPRVIQLAEFKENSDKEATIRCTIQRDKEHFRQTEGMKGYWELVSFQEEMAALKQEINDLKNQLTEKDRTIEDLRKVKTEDDFVKRLMKETKKMFNHERSKAVGISQLLDKLGRGNDFEDLDAWIEGREKPTIRQPQSVTVNGTIVLNNETNIDKNYGPNIDNHDGGTLSLPERIIDNNGN